MRLARLKHSTPRKKSSAAKRAQKVTPDKNQTRASATTLTHAIAAGVTAAAAGFRLVTASLCQAWSACALAACLILKPPHKPNTNAPLDRCEHIHAAPQRSADEKMSVLRCSDRYCAHPSNFPSQSKLQIENKKEMRGSYLIIPRYCVRGLRALQTLNPQEKI